MDNDKSKIINVLLNEIKDASYAASNITPKFNGPVYYNTNITIRLHSEIRDALRNISEGGGGGTTDYSKLTNKPQIGGIELNGNKTVAELGLATEEDNNKKADKIKVVNHGISDTTFELTPNTFHVWGEVTSLNLTLAAPTDNTIANEYLFQFTSGATATTLILPDAIKWFKVPTINPSKTYQISILNNIGIALEV